MKDIKNLLADKKRIVITTHINPDGDALGSSIGLHCFLDNSLSPTITTSKTEFVPAFVPV